LWGEYLSEPPYKVDVLLHDKVNNFAAIVIVRYQEMFKATLAEKIQQWLALKDIPVEVRLGRVSYLLKKRYGA
jgi:hypothetical protein